jgi:hypothetical protein
MGAKGSKSKTTINNLSQQLTNISMSVVQSCVVNSSQSQDLNITNSGFSFWTDYSLEQSTDISSQCFQDSSKQAQLQNQLINEISQATSADGVALWGAFGSTQSAATANLTNIIQTNVTMNNIQKNYNLLKQGQTINVTNSGAVLFQSVNAKQGAQVFAAATLKSIDDAGVFNSISSYVDQNSSSTQAGPFDFIGDIFSGISSQFIYGMLFFVVIIIGIIIAVRSTSSVTGGFIDLNGNYIPNQSELGSIATEYFD